ncbi:MAG TPA: MFS transporter [Solirubrobacteraceae bacterium]|nr:MFS transporter [Solirubrobacteraceae bacterium]
MSNLARQLRVLRHRDFRYLWLAQSASVVGDCIVIVALALFVIELTGSATDLGLVLAAASLPLVAFLLIGGVWADRLPRHRVMVVTDLVRFALHALLATLIFTGIVAIWHLVVIEAVFGGAEAFFRPAANGLLPQTVPEAEIQQANGLSTLSNNIGEFAGPALATALVLGLGAGWAFALDAATFLASAALLSRVRPRRRERTHLAGALLEAPAPVAMAAQLPQPAAAPAPATHEDSAHVRVGVWHEIREGYREVRSRSWVWATLAAFCAALFTGLAPWFVLGPVVARAQYGEIGVYGLVSAVLGIGTILGSLLGIGWRPRFPMRAAMLAILLWPSVAVLYAAGVTLYLVVPAMLLGGAGIALFDVWWMTALAERIPPEKLSRVSSYDWMVSLALLPLGYALAGPLAGALGAVEVLLGGSVIAAIALALGLLPRQTRMLRRFAA